MQEPQENTSSTVTEAGVVIHIRCGVKKLLFVYFSLHGGGQQKRYLLNPPKRVGIRRQCFHD